jgi:Ni2+-binding GTPase involved in maturation of urease and hydrogenase
LVEKLLRSLKEGDETTIIVHGKFGVGKTALVEYVTQKYAMDLKNIFLGGVFEMKYGHDSNIIASQEKLLRHLMQLGKVGPFSKTIPRGVTI